jgi:hypothetical protein
MPESEEYQVQLLGVTVLELITVPDISRDWLAPRSRVCRCLDSNQTRSMIIPSNHRRLRRLRHRLLFLGGRLPLRPLLRRAPGEAGHRLLRSHKRGKRQCTLDSFGAWSMVRRIRDHRDEARQPAVTPDRAVQSKLKQNHRRIANGAKGY